MLQNIFRNLYYLSDPTRATSSHLNFIFVDKLRELAIILVIQYHIVFSNIPEFLLLRFRYRVNLILFYSSNNTEFVATGMKLMIEFSFS